MWCVYTFFDRISVPTLFLFCLFFALKNCGVASLVPRVSQAHDDHDFVSECVCVCLGPGFLCLSLVVSVFFVLPFLFFVCRVAKPVVQPNTDDRSTLERTPLCVCVFFFYIEMTSRRLYIDTVSVGGGFCRHCGGIS